MSKTARIFIGYDSRQPVAYHVLCQSLLTLSSMPLSTTPLRLSALPMTRRGLTEFTYSRFLVPWLCDYEGLAVFMDSDIIAVDDPAEIFLALGGDIEKVPAVSCVKFGGDLDYERPSVMLFNCSKCKTLTPEFVDDQSNALFDFAWTGGDIGELPDCWNHLVGYQEDMPDRKLIHFTQGVPGYKECRDVDYSDAWHGFHAAANYTQSWLEVMGPSKHAMPVLRRLREVS